MAATIGFFFMGPPWPGLEYIRRHGGIAVNTAHTIEIREARIGDLSLLEAFVVELQDHLMPMEPELAPGSESAAPYLTELLERIERSGGRVFVAERHGNPCGFVAITIEDASVEYRAE